MLDRGEAGRGWEAQNTRKAEIAGQAVTRLYFITMGRRG